MRVSRFCSLGRTRALTDTTDNATRVACTWARISVALLAIAVLPLAAGDLTINLNPAKSQVLWTLSDVLHTVHGTFKLTSGVLHLDTETSKCSGEIVVDAKSGESGSGARDGRMHKNVLESAKYPVISFKPDHVEGAINRNGDSQVQIHGLFTIHGADHELTVPAKVQLQGNELTASIDFAVPFVKWGMKDPSTLFLKVKDFVEIHFQASGSVAQ